MDLCIKQRAVMVAWTGMLAGTGMVAGTGIFAGTNMVVQYLERI